MPGAPGGGGGSRATIQCDSAPVGGAMASIGRFRGDGGNDQAISSAVFINQSQLRHHAYALFLAWRRRLRRAVDRRRSRICGRRFRLRRFFLMRRSQLAAIRSGMSRRFQVIASARQSSMVVDVGGANLHEVRQCVLGHAIEFFWPASVAGRRRKDGRRHIIGAYIRAQP